MPPQLAGPNLVNFLHLAHRRTFTRAVPSLKLFIHQLSELCLHILQSQLNVLEALAPWAVQVLSSPELSALSSLVTIDGFCVAQAVLELTTYLGMTSNSQFSCLHLPRITVMYHQAWLLILLFFPLLFSYFTFSLCF